MIYYIITKEEKKIRGFRGVRFFNSGHFLKNKHEIYNTSCEFLIIFGQISENMIATSCFSIINQINFFEI